MKGKIQEKTKKRALHRLKIMRGKIEGLIKMVEEEKYCVDVLTQSRSVQESLKSFDSMMLENHIKQHIVKQIEAGDVDSATEELVKIYKLSRK